MRHQFPLIARLVKRLRPGGFISSHRAFIFPLTGRYAISIVVATDFSYNMTTEKTAYPLYWPDGRQRCRNRRTNKHFKASFATARDQCEAEVRRLGGKEIIISTNLPLKRDGRPQAVEWGKHIPDPGVAVYFKRHGKEFCFACDAWSHVQDNMHAITLTINALRGIARWGTGDMMEAAFRGFMALPAPGETSGFQWWSVLGVSINATSDQVKDAYRLLVKKHHPDTGGDAEMFRRVQEAYQQFERMAIAA